MQIILIIYFFYKLNNSIITNSILENNFNARISLKRCIHKLHSNFVKFNNKKNN